MIEESCLLTIFLFRFWGYLKYVAYLTRSGDRSLFSEGPTWWLLREKRW